MKWAYFALCELAAAAFFWMPLWWWRLPPIGLTVAILLCLSRSWSAASVNSIKPMSSRVFVDEWVAPVNALFGNPEDGVSGRFAFGAWYGAYNPTGSRWRAICWNCRNWLAGFNYLTWPWASTPPLIVKPYGSHQLKLGWQQRYGRTVMVCSFW